ncbi:hypothetical protein UNSWCD_337 [Campylobacter concisus UNSWCD]|uniref:hypothetical protein n=1 Tax=Campylobacter concisus TaxID=199 RepID=UPI00025A65FD|nr:hypothetical protein [Campylobacter concisus]EIF07206.1 hypothetical protein UNSWCD_337 [Campylobacter concisus UNSWCD]
MKKIGRISALNRRVVRQNLATSMSLLIGKERFSGVFSPEIEKYEVGDLVEIKYNKVGFLNKIETIRLIAKSSEESGLFARIKNLIFMLSYFYLCFIASVFIYYGVTLEFNIIRFIITLVAACFLFLMGKFAYLKFLIFRYFIFG